MDRMQLGEAKSFPYPWFSSSRCVVGIHAGSSVQLAANCSYQVGHGMLGLIVGDVVEVTLRSRWNRVVEERGPRPNQNIPGLALRHPSLLLHEPRCWVMARMAVVDNLSRCTTVVVEFWRETKFGDVLENALSTRGKSVGVALNELKSFRHVTSPSQSMSMFQLESARFWTPGWIAPFILAGSTLG